MKPHELVALLVKATEKSTMQVATEMHRSSFQGTLYKFINGEVASPSRSTAERIARYFKLPVDALYDVQAATRVADERGLTARSRHSLEAREREGTYLVQPLHPPPLSRFPAAVESRIQALDTTQRKALEAVIVAFLDATAPRSQKAKRMS